MEFGELEKRRGGGIGKEGEIGMEDGGRLWVSLLGGGRASVVSTLQEPELALSVRPRRDHHS